MRYEEITLRPVAGAIDREAITAWLSAQDHAFVHRWECPIWHLCWDARDVFLDEVDAVFDVIQAMPLRFPLA